MSMLKREYAKDFESSKTLEEITIELESVVDFKAELYHSSTSLSKDFYGEQENPDSFSFLKRPSVFGVADLMIRRSIDPKVNLQVRENKVSIRIHDPSAIPQFIGTLAFILIIVILYVISAGEFSNEDVAIIAIWIGVVLITNLLLIFRFKSIVKKVEKRIIKNLI